MGPTGIAKITAVSLVKQVIRPKATKTFRLLPATKRPRGREEEISQSKIIRATMGD